MKKIIIPLLAVFLIAGVVYAQDFYVENYYEAPLQGTDAILGAPTQFIVATSVTQGFGTTTPWAFHSINPTSEIGSRPIMAVGSSSATHFLIDNAGNIGIATTTPGAVFSVNGTALFGSSVNIQGALNVAGNTTLATVSITGQVKGDLEITGDAYINGGDLALGTGTATTTMTSSGANLNITGQVTVDNIVADSTTASSTLPLLDVIGLNVYNQVKIGGTATTTFDSAGNFVLQPAGTFTIDAQSFDSLTDDATLSNNSGDLRVVDVTCTDCLNATEIEDIYLFNSGDTITGALTFSGVATDITTVSNEHFVITPNGSGGVGIATTTPWGQLSVEGQGTNPAFAVSDTSNNTDFIVTASGNVGIGTTTPSELLEVDKDQNAATAIKVNNTNAGNAARSTLRLNSDDKELRLNAWGSGASGNYVSIGTVTVTDLLFQTQNNDRMIIKDSGNVGIGTTAPDRKFHVMDSDTSLSPASANTAFILEENDDTNFEIITPSGNSGGIIFSDGANQGGIRYRHGTDDMIFRTGGSDVVAIDSSGNVGIGETSPSYKFHVVDDTANEYAAYIINDNADGSGLRIRADDTDGDEYLLYTEYGGTNVHTVFKTDGNVGIGVTPEATHSSYGTVRFFDTGTIYGRRGNAGAGYPLYYGNNFHQDTSGNDEYIVTDEATQYKQQSGEHIFKVVASGSADTDITWIDAMTIDVTGNVGIGTTAPVDNGVTLTISNVATSFAANTYYQNSATGATAGDGFTVGVDNDENAVLLNRENTHMLFNTNDGERMRITSAGNVGIGTTTPQAKLDVFTGQGWNSALPLVNISNMDPNTLEALALSVRGGADDPSTNTFEVGDWSGNTDFVVRGDGNVGIGMTNPSVELDVTGDIEYTGTITDVSDERLKENITDITNALNTITALQGRTFNMLNTTNVEYGLVAQEVQSIVPEAVSVTDIENGYLGVSYLSFTPILIEAIKEQQTQIESLQEVWTDFNLLWNKVMDNSFKIGVLEKQVDELQDQNQMLKQALCEKEDYEFCE